MYDVIIDPVAGGDAGTFFSKLKPNDRIVICEAAGGFPPPDFGMGLLGAFFASPTVSAFSLNSVSPKDVMGAIHAVIDMVAHGRLSAVLAGKIALEKVAEAHRALEDGGATGKFVIAM